MSVPSSQWPRCPECAAVYRPPVERCWLCGAKLPDAGATPVPSAPAVEPASAAPPRPPAAATFSLTSLFLVMTLVAVGAGVFAAAPGLGIVFIVLATPALLRTIVVASQEKARGGVVTPGQKILAFLGSVGVVLLVAVSIGVALLTACLTACAGYALSSEVNFTIAGGVLGGVAGLALTGWLLELIWRRQRKV